MLNAEPPQDQQQNRGQTAAGAIHRDIDERLGAVPEVGRQGHVKQLHAGAIEGVTGSLFHQGRDDGRKQARNKQDGHGRNRHRHRHDLHGAAHPEAAYQSGCHQKLQGERQQVRIEEEACEKRTDLAALLLVSHVVVLVIDQHIHDKNQGDDGDDDLEVAMPAGGHDDVANVRLGFLGPGGLGPRQ